MLVLRTTEIKFSCSYKVSIRSWTPGTKCGSNRLTRNADYVNGAFPIFLTAVTRIYTGSVSRLSGSLWASLKISATAMFVIGNLRTMFYAYFVGMSMVSCTNLTCLALVG